MSAPTADGTLDRQLEEHRSELRAYCYRMLASPFDADDAVQETLIRAWKAYEVAELLDTTTASINSALQRARATLEQTPNQPGTPAAELSSEERELLVRYVKAFEAYDIDALTALIHEDATQSMPPYDLWLTGRDDIFTWWFGPGIGCKGSRVIPTVAANGSPAFGQYKPTEDGGYEPWALQVLEIVDGKIAEMTFFLGTETLFPLFGLPPRLDA